MDIKNSSGIWSDRISEGALTKTMKTPDCWQTLQVGCSKFRYKSDTKSARILLVKLLIFNTLYCKIVL